MLQLEKTELAGLNLKVCCIPSAVTPLGIRRCRRLNEHEELAPDRRTAEPFLKPEHSSASAAEEIDPLYLFACQVAWEQEEDPSAGWELISASESANSDTRAHARALLASSRHLPAVGSIGSKDFRRKRQNSPEDKGMKAPYELEIIENCAECAGRNDGRFCEFSPDVLEVLNEVSHKMTLPAGAILFVEGQTPRGVFIVCSGSVSLSTTSREGRGLILESAEAGHVLGLSATVSGAGYEITAETATPCQISFIDRKHFLEFLEGSSEVGLHATQCLSRDYRAAYHDIHDLILTRSSAGKLAKLLLSQVVDREGEDDKDFRRLPMTHEEMAQRIGTSRETVTRLLSNLRRKRLIRIDGTRLVIKNRTALEALAV